MGCVSVKDKIENEIIRLKMIRTEVRYERQKQLKLLKDNYGCDFKPSNIPDYCNLNETKENCSKKNSISIIRNSKTIKLKPKKSKSISIKHKKSISSKDTNCCIKIKTNPLNEKKTLKL